MKSGIVLFVSVLMILACKSKQVQSDYFVDQNWIEVHFRRNMSTKDLVDLRERLVPLGVMVNFVTIQRDSNKNIIQLQIEVSDGKGKFARSKTEFLDEIPYGIRIHRGDLSDEGFKVGPLYTRRPQ